MKQYKVIHNVETNEIEQMELTAEDLAEFKILEERTNARKQEELALANARTVLLEKLGITEEEAKLIFS